MMIISPAKHKGNHTIICRMLAVYERQHGQQLKIADLANSTIIVAYDKHRGIRGGAWLTLKKVTDLPEAIKAPLNKNQYWECSGIHFCIDENDATQVSVPNLFSLKQTFYEDLYECLINFGITHDVKFVMTHLANIEHQCLGQIGKLPFAGESSNAHMTYGLLPVTLEAQDLYHARYEERIVTPQVVIPEFTKPCRSKA